MSDGLIERLAGDLRPVRRASVPIGIGVAIALGAVASVIGMILWIGLRPDFPAAFRDPIFWTKAGYASLIAAAGFWASERLSRPGGTARGAVIAIGIIVALGVVLGAIQLMGAPPTSMRRLILGSTALVCPWYILALSAPLLIATLIAMRQLAPTRPTLGGFAAGLLAGGSGAFVYSLHCTESGLPFLATWYTLGIALTAAIGAIAGRWLLRW